MNTHVITDLDLGSIPLFRKGKVRHVYDCGDALVFVASDRVSAFDCILPNGIPYKGEVLTQVSKSWFSMLPSTFKHHFISDNVDDFPPEFHPYKAQLQGRSMLVHKTELIEVECIVRGYVVGSGWKDYVNTGEICGITLPKGLQLASKLDSPIFTPASKAFDGLHDENISFEKMVDTVGAELAHTLKELSLQLYTFGRDYAQERGIILADTKFEFGIKDGEIYIIDELLTPDSSRYWAIEDYKEGISPPSFDKQIIRDYLEQSGWDKQPPAPVLPDEIVNKASSQYLEIMKRLNNTNQ